MTNVELRLEVCIRRRGVLGVCKWGTMGGRTMSVDWNISTNVSTLSWNVPTCHVCRNEPSSTFWAGYVYSRYGTRDPNNCASNLMTLHKLD